MGSKTNPQSLLDDRFLPHLATILKHTNGRRMVQNISTLVKTERWNSFDRFHDSTRILKRMFRLAGLNAEVTGIPTGGVLGDGRWIIQQAQDVISAKAHVLVNGKRRSLVDYRKNPWQIAQWSAATPKGGVTGDLIILDDPDELQQLPVNALQGKFVLTSARLHGTLPLFYAQSVAGVLCDCPVPKCPDSTMWGKWGWGGIPVGAGLARVTGLVLSRSEGRKLRALHRKNRGKLKVHADVQVRSYSGTHDVVSAVLTGSTHPEQEIWSIAHGAEPGAADNASGVIACVEMASVLESLIRAGRLPRPKRSIRFVNAYECYGFFHYLEHHVKHRPLAGVCVDTIGVKNALCEGTVNWHKTIPASAGFVDALGERILRAVHKQTRVWKGVEVKPFLSTDDTLIGDPQYGFPCPWITCHPFQGYHSSFDVPAILDPARLRATTAAMALYLYVLADLDNDALVSADRMMESSLAREAKELARAEKTREKAAFLQFRCLENRNRLASFQGTGRRLNTRNGTSDGLQKAMSSFRKSVTTNGKGLVSSQAN